MNTEVQNREKSLNAIFGWIGGKRQLRKYISEYIPEQIIPIKDRRLKYYIEVFGGVAWMLLYKNRWFEHEIYNDFNNELTNLFNIIKFHPKEFIKQFEFLPQSQFFFNYFHDFSPLTDIQKAVVTYYKYAYSFSAKGDNCFGYKPKSRNNLINNIDLLSQRFDNVMISNNSFEKIIDRFNKENVFLYLDPPYFEKEYLYQVKFSNENHYHLKDILTAFKGRFLMSYNNHPEIISLYNDFNIKEVTTKYSAFKNSREEIKEILIMNY
jgi:DNA adenine methylase